MIKSPPKQPARARTGTRVGVHGGSSVQTGLQRCLPLLPPLISHSPPSLFAGVSSEPARRSKNMRFTSTAERTCSFLLYELKDQIHRKGFSGW